MSQWNERLCLGVNLSNYPIRQSFVQCVIHSIDYSSGKFQRISKHLYDSHQQLEFNQKL